MTILQGQDAWHQLDRWNQPCGRPTYRHRRPRAGAGPAYPRDRHRRPLRCGKLPLERRRPGRPDPAREPVERLSVIDGNAVPFIRCGQHEFFLAFQPASGASTWRPASPGQADPEPPAPLGCPTLIEACPTLLRLWDGYDDTGPVPLDDAVDTVRTALTSAAGSAVPDTSPITPYPHNRRHGNAITRRHR